MSNNYNEVSDLGLAASLSASDFVIVSVDKSNPRRVIFVFEKSNELEQAIDLFWANKLMLPASTLLDHMRKLKTRIYG
jgi:hypothetical protein